MNYTMVTPKRRLRPTVRKQERATLKTSMLVYAAAAGKAIGEMRAAELEARRSAARKKAQQMATPEVPPVSEVAGN